MGAEPSKVGETLPRPRSIRRLPSTFHSRLVAGWQQRHLRTQFFATVRHTERADSWGALVDGQRWITTEDFRRWGPIDPPLSDEGLVAAGVAGKRLRMAAEDAGADIHVVVSSPYFRCVQTAVEICRELGDGARMLLDSSLGEIYGPSVMGQDEPAGSTRPTEMLLEYCRSRGVRCPDRAVGRQPVWPETLNRARLRFAGRFLEYVHRGTKAQRNFVIVSHADCVGAALRLMPSHADRVVQRAEFGAMFLAQRSTLASASASPGGSIDASPGGCLDMEASPSNSEGAMPPPVPDGWQVQTFDLWLRKKLSGHNTIKDNLRALAQGSRMTEGRVAQLLSELADEPLEEIDSGCATADRKELYREGFLRGGSRISVSTFLFGASDVGNMSDVAGSCSRTTSMDRSEMTMSRGNSLQSPKLKRHLRHKGTGSFEEGVVDRLMALGSSASRQTDGVDRSFCLQSTAPSPVAEEGCQPEDSELLSPSARVPERAERACDMSGSKLFQRRFPGRSRSGLEQSGAPALGAAQAPQVASSGCCGSSRAATRPEVELLGPGKSLLLQRRAVEGIPATKLGTVRTLRVQL